MGRRRAFSWLSVVVSALLILCGIIAALYFRPTPERGTAINLNESGRTTSQYKEISEAVYDEARLVEASEFRESKLLERFRAFVSSTCATRKLARLIVAPTEDDLTVATNSNWPELNVESIRNLSLRYPSLFGQDIRQMRSAEVVCVGQDATALVRDRSNVARYQIFGKQNTREFEAGGKRFTLQAFRADSPIDGRQLVSAFVRTNEAPTLESAIYVRDYLEKATGVFVVLVLRDDPFFWYEDGPRFDPYQMPTPQMSGAAFLKRPYIFCPPSYQTKTCKVQSWQ